MEDKTYTVIELAENAGVARTTINDWLTKYSPYLDFKTIGRRRVYLQATLDVIKEISDLRNQGLTFQEIESELAKKHPLRAEPEESRAQEPEREPQKSIIPAEQQTAIPTENGDDFALIAKRQSDELGKVIADSFRNMADRMQTLEGKANRAERKLYFGYAILFLLLLLLCISAYLLHSGLAGQTVRSERNTELTAANGNAIRTVEEKTIQLTGSATELKRGVDELKSGLERQREDFEKALSEMKSAKEAEIASMKEAFAAEKKKVLSELEQLAKEKKELELKQELLQKELQKPAQSGKGK